MDNSKKKKRFLKICKDIKEVKIQGARAIARAALDAYHLFPSTDTEHILLNLRSTEPMLRNTLKFYKKIGYNKTIAHFDSAQEAINKNVMKILKQGWIIFTHCHSTNVVNAMVYAKRYGKKFSVLNTETRPLYQGHRTALELALAHIPVTTIIDAAGALELKKVDAVFLGADAILKNGAVINKIGSGMFAELAYNRSIPVYIIADSWKWSSRDVKIEEREHSEVWKRASVHVKIKNPAFELVQTKYIKAIVSELGILNPKEFVKKVKKLKNEI